MATWKTTVASRTAGLAVWLALCCWALTPAWVDAPVWAWGLGLLGVLAQVATTAGSGARAVPPGTPVQAGLHIAAGAAALSGWVLLGAVACAVGLLGGWHHDEGWRTMRQDGKAWLTALLAWWLLSRLSQREGALPLPPWLPNAAAWSGALALQMAVALVAVGSTPRAHLPVGAIPWATAVAMGVAAAAPWCVAAWNARRQQRAPSGAHHPVEFWILAAACALGVAAVVLSRSRAAWVVLPWLLWLAMTAGKRPLRTAAWGLVAGGLGLALALAYDAHQPVSVERGLRVLDLWQELTQSGPADAGSSVGSRRLMWSAAWSAITDHPLWGIGAAQRIALVQSVIPPALMPDVAPLLHVHQQFLNQGLDHGLPGMAAAVCTALGPLWAAWKLRGSTAALSLVGVSVVHITGLFFNANMTHGPYVFAWCLCVSWVLGRHLLAGPRLQT